MNSSIRIFARGIAISALAVASGAYAQEEATDQPVEAADTQADTFENVVIVTATRRASPLSDVPIAVSAVTGASLQNSGANDIRQLNQLAPSLLVSSTGSESNAVARIRGIGTVGDNPGLESSVAVFIDGVYRSRTGVGMSDLGEVERIEVLRGPQGTLFGRNASAGLINIVTKGPEFTFGAKGEITYGNYDYWRASASVTGPVSEAVALRLDGVWSKRDGFVKLVDATGAKVGDTNDRDRYLIRGQALIEPNDALSVRLIGDYTNRDESCCAALYSSKKAVTAAGINPVSPIATVLETISGVPVTVDPFSRTTTITPGRDYVSNLKDWGVSAEINYDFDWAKLTSITAYRHYKSRDYGDYDYSAADIIYRDPNTNRQFKTFTQELRLQGAAFDDRLDWLIGGYYSNEKLTLVDNVRFGSDYGLFATCRIFSASVPASVLPCNSRPFMKLGVIDPNFSPLVGPLAGPSLLNTALTTLLNIGANGTTAGDTDARYMQDSESLAAFTHNIVHITDKIDLTVGLRYTHEKKKLRATFANDNAACATLQSLPGLAQLATTPITSTTPAQVAQAISLAGGVLTLGCLGNGGTGLNALSLNDGFSDDELSGTAVLSYKPMRNLLLYASYSKGYKAGGYNLDRFELGNTGLSPLASAPVTYFFPRSPADAQTLRFAAEKANAYEIGLKYNSRKWSANIAAFRAEFDDFQLNTFNGTSFVVQNINGCGSALSAGRTCTKSDVEPGLVSQGVELELSLTPARSVRVGAGLTYAETKFKKRLVGSNDGMTPLDPALFLLPGNTNSNAPEIVTTVSFAWTPDIGSNGLTGLVYFDGRMTGDYNTGSDLFPEKVQDGYSVWNARIGIRGPDERWAVEFWGQNIFNTDYTQVTFNSPLQGSGTSAAVQAGLASSATQLFSSYLAEPRTYGITLRGKF